MIPHLAPYQKRYFPIVIKRILRFRISYPFHLFTSFNHTLYIFCNIRHAVFSVFLTQLNDCTSNDRTVCALTHLRCLLRSGDSESDRTWNIISSFTSFTIAPMSVVIADLVPVTPSEETQYTNPDASLRSSGFCHGKSVRSMRSDQFRTFAYAVKFFFLFKWNIRKNQTIHSNTFRFLKKSFCSVREHNICICHKTSGICVFWRISFTISKILSVVTPPVNARRFAACITGPSAVGSEMEFQARSTSPLLSPSHRRFVLLSQDLGHHM